MLFAKSGIFLLARAFGVNFAQQKRGICDRNTPKTKAFVQYLHE